MNEEGPQFEQERISIRELWESASTLSKNLEDIPTPDILREILPKIEYLYQQYLKLKEEIGKTAIDFSFIRHTQTTHNEAKKFTGTVDAELTEKGYEQAQAMGKNLEGEEFDLVVRSGLSRTDVTVRETLKSAGIEIPEERFVIDQRINERCYGEYGGQKKDSLAAEEKAKGFSYGRFFPGGENYSMVLGKLIWFLNDVYKLAQKFQEQNNRPIKILVSGHNGSFRMLFGILDEIKDREEIRKKKTPQAEVIRYSNQQLPNWPKFISNEELQNNIDTN